MLLKDRKWTPFLRMILLMRFEVQPRDLQGEGQTGVVLLTFTVVIRLVWTFRAKKGPTRYAGVGMGTTSPIEHHHWVSIVLGVAEDDTIASILLPRSAL